MDQLERAREELRRASDEAGRVVQEQLDAAEQGLGTEAEGGLDEAERVAHSDGKADETPGPKVDRVVEVDEKLAALADETEDPSVAERIRTARDHVDASLREHPQGG